MTVLNLLNYTRIENAHKARKKLSFCVAVICVQLLGCRTDTGFCETL